MAATGNEKTIVKGKTTDTAILVVSFGTSCNENRERTIGAIENSIQKAFPEYDVRRAFTSRIILDKLKVRDGLEIDNVEQALDRMAADGIKKLVVQPTHLLAGLEYTDLANILHKYEHKFELAVLGKPLLSDTADYEAVIKAITDQTSSYDDGQTAICYLGHGTKADANHAYEILQQKLKTAVFANYYIGTVKAEPNLRDIITAVKKNASYKKILLKPLMVVAGSHANYDMDGKGGFSWRTVLEEEGYCVECCFEGLGQLADIQDIYVMHIRKAVATANLVNCVRNCNFTAQ